MDALIGSVLPVGETAIGFAVGLGVDTLMMAPTGGGKNVGGRFADLGEWGWNGIKGAGKNFLSTVKRSFG